MAPLVLLEGVSLVDSTKLFPKAPLTQMPCLYTQTQMGVHSNSKIKIHLNVVDEQEIQMS